MIEYSAPTLGYAEYGPAGRDDSSLFLLHTNRADRFLAVPSG